MKTRNEDLEEMPHYVMVVEVSQRYMVCIVGVGSIALADSSCSCIIRSVTEHSIFNTHL